MDRTRTTDNLLARWRAAERALVGLDPESAAWKVGRSMADQAWQRYEQRLNEERGASKGKEPPAPSYSNSTPARSQMTPETL